MFFFKYFFIILLPCGVLIYDYKAIFVFVENILLYFKLTALSSRKDQINVSVTNTVYIMCNELMMIVIMICCS